MISTLMLTAQAAGISRLNTRVTLTMCMTGIYTVPTKGTWMSTP
jgi:hypothetical protein